MLEVEPAPQEIAVIACEPAGRDVEGTEPPQGNEQSLVLGEAGCDQVCDPGPEMSLHLVDVGTVDPGRVEVRPPRTDEMVDGTHFTCPLTRGPWAGGSSRQRVLSSPTQWFRRNSATARWNSSGRSR